MAGVQGRRGPHLTTLQRVHRMHVTANPAPGDQPVQLPHRSSWVRAAAIAIPSVFFVPAGCVAIGPENELLTSYTRSTIDADWERMKDSPVPLERPLLVLSGYRSPHFMAPRLSQRLVALTSGNEDDALTLSYMLHHRINDIATLVVDRVEERWPSDDPDATIEVDVAAISMGGLVARLAALPPELRPAPEPGDEPPADGKRLRIGRLYTFATPHQGAKLALQLHPDSAARAMRPGSNFLEALNERTTNPSYEMVCYAQTNDNWVGATNTAPPGQDPLWARGTLLLSHFNTSDNKILITDVARRLRGEEPWIDVTSPPPSD